MKCRFFYDESRKHDLLDLGFKNFRTERSRTKCTGVPRKPQLPCVAKMSFSALQKTFCINSVLLKNRVGGGGGRGVRGEGGVGGVRGGGWVGS
jgi:hypothetical protein